MATTRETADFLLAKLGHAGRFEARPMFGEFGLYADGRIVGLICDNQLYVKILPASAGLASVCDQDAPYPGAKPHYVVEESQWSTRADLSSVLFAIAAALPEKKKPSKGAAGPKAERKATKPGKER